MERQDDINKDEVRENNIDRDIINENEVETQQYEK
jgi:hypothetical protein